MRKLIFFLTLLLSLTNLFSQENPIYGSKVVIRKRDTSSAELQIINSTRNVSGFLKNTGGGNTTFKIPSQSEIAALPDSLLARYTKTQADARFKSISYIPDWLELTSVPSNFSTTYALSNDIQDSLLNKVSRSGSYADPSWITSLDYSKLTGTIPTWNQNTTGNAATVTNGVYTTGSYANPAWITSLDYSKLTGTIPTWNQNTTGSATTWFNAGTYDAAGNNASASVFMGFNSTSNKWAAYDATYIKSWLGLGTAAYTASSAYYAAGSTVSNSTQWDGSPKPSGYTTTGTVDKILGGLSGAGDPIWLSNTRVQSFLGLGDYAYRSAGLAELSGANFTGAIDVRHPNSYFGSEKGYIYFTSDQINSYFSTDADATLNINYYGYNQGLTRFRNFLVHNGKGEAIFYLGGSNKNATFYGGVSGKNIYLTDAGTTDYVGAFVSNGSGANNILLAGKSGVSNGFTVTYNGTSMVYSMADGGLSVSGNTNSSGFNRSGSSDSYFLLGGGGHVLTSTYATSASLSGYVDISNNQYEIGGNKTFLADVVVNGKLTGSRILGNTASYTSAATISSGITTAFCSNSSGSNYTLTMPSASGVTGQIMTVILTSGTLANTVTLSGINGGSYVLSCQASVVLVSDGTNWKIASVYNNVSPCS